MHLSATLEDCRRKLHHPTGTARLELVSLMPAAQKPGPGAAKKKEATWTWAPFPRASASQMPACDVLNQGRMKVLLGDTADDRNPI